MWFLSNKILEKSGFLMKHLQKWKTRVAVWYIIPNCIQGRVSQFTLPVEACESAWLPTRIPVPDHISAPLMSGKLYIIVNLMYGYIITSKYGFLTSYCRASSRGNNFKMLKIDIKGCLLQEFIIAKRKKLNFTNWKEIIKVFCNKG